MAQPSALQLSAQVAHEIEGFRRAAVRYREAAAAQQPGDLPAAQVLLREIVPALSARIKSAQEDATVQLGQAGRHPEWAWPIQATDPERLAVITVVCALRSFASARGDSGPTEEGALRVAQAIAAAMRVQIEHDRWIASQTGEAGRDVLRAFRLRYPKANRATWARWRRKVHALREEWPEAVSVATGGMLVGLLCETAPRRFSVETRRITGGRTGRFLVLSEETVGMLEDIEARAAVARPMLMPMLMEPLPWRYE